MSKVSKLRLDIYMLERGFAETREKARSMIMEGKVYVNGQKEDKAGTMIKEDAIVEYRGEKLKYVSRGGYKLEKAAKVFQIDFDNKVCLDIGSSTGGFTDYMLQSGAKKVYAIDSGTNQLDYRLRIDDRVISLENTNARYLTIDMLGNERPEIATIDVSFISLVKILPAVYELLNQSGIVIMLIKPQFEAGREEASKNNGVIKNKSIHSAVIKNIISEVDKLGFIAKGLDYSPIKGPAGNIEFLLYATKESNIDNVTSYIEENIVIQVVDAAHEELDKE